MNYDSHQLKTALKRFFGFNDFLAGQLEIISSILNRRDTIVVMPTGAGKSLCYQFPAALLNGTAIVISPLIALMKDQVDSLKDTNLKSAFINSSQSIQEIQTTIENAIRGDYKLIYIAPERLESKIFIQDLRKLNLSFLAVDEAHCISEWGHDFRPSYLNIANILDGIKDLPKIALTATATPEVQDDIVESLKMNSPNRFIKGFDRKNLRYITEYSENKTVKLKNVLKKFREPVIVYCGTRKRVENISSYLLKNGINAIAYHAGLSPETRIQAQNRFMNEEAEVIVATNAFGMGINKANVRAVIHCDLTQTLESYYQEAGRAGRDGIESDCILLYTRTDRNLQEFFIENNYPSKVMIVFVYNALKSYLQINNSDDSTFFDIQDFARKLNTTVSSINSVLNILELNNLITQNNNHKFSLIKLISDASTIRDYINYLDLRQKIALEFLLRNIPASSFSDFQKVNLSKICDSIGMTIQEFKEQLRIFEFSGIISIKEIQSGSNISINSYDIKDLSLYIDFDKIAERKKRAYLKLDKMVEYAETNKCKRNFILDYFFERDYIGFCGKCSSCNQKSNKLWKIEELENGKGIIDFLENKKIQNDGSQEKKYEEPKISVQSKKVYKLVSEGKSLNSISAELKISEADVGWCLQELIENDYFIKVEQFVDYLTYQKIKKIVEKNPLKPLRIIRENYDEVIEFPILRIATAFARKELEINSNIFKKKK